MSSYKWTLDNATLTYQDFVPPNEPSSASQRCVAMNPASNFKWHDAECHLDFHAVCEAEAVSFYYFHYNFLATSQTLFISYISDISGHYPMQGL